MHFENASAKVMAGDCEADFDDDEGLLADVDGGLLAEPPHAAIATEPTMTDRTVRVAIDHGLLRDGSAVTAISRLRRQEARTGLPITPSMIYP
jgi:hypothetical protein